jgi:hypothetical protein
LCEFVLCIFVQCEVVWLLHALRISAVVSDVRRCCAMHDENIWAILAVFAQL